MQRKIAFQLVNSFLIMVENESKIMEFWKSLYKISKICGTRNQEVFIQMEENGSLSIHHQFRWSKSSTACGKLIPQDWEFTATVSVCLSTYLFLLDTGGCRGLVYALISVHCTLLNANGWCILACHRSSWKGCWQLLLDTKRMEWWYIKKIFTSIFVDIQTSSAKVPI